MPQTTHGVAGGCDYCRALAKTTGLDADGICKARARQAQQAQWSRQHPDLRSPAGAADAAGATGEPTTHGVAGGCDYCRALAKTMGLDADGICKARARQAQRSRQRPDLRSPAGAAGEPTTHGEEAQQRPDLRSPAGAAGAAGAGVLWWSSTDGEVPPEVPPEAPDALGADAADGVADAFDIAEAPDALADAADGVADAFDIADVLDYFDSD